MKISFILPTYNEKDNIIILIPSIIDSIKKLPHAYEILVIDDNSPDKTAKVVMKFFSKNKKIKTYIRTRNRGLAQSIYYGVKKSTGDIIIIMDTDFSHNPKVLPNMISKIKSYDMVIGSRFAKGGGGEDKVRYAMSNAYNIFLRVFLRINVSDFLFGYVCIKKEFMDTNHLVNKKIFSGFGDYFIKLVYYTHKSGGKITEIPAIYKSRIYGESKSNVTQMFFTYGKTALDLFVEDIFG